MNMAQDAPGFAERALVALKQRGMRITQPRRTLIQVLAESDSPLSASELFARAKSRSKACDLATVYRVLSALSDLGLVHHIASLDGWQACQTTHELGPDRQHLVCGECGQTVEVPWTPEELSTLKNLATREGYSSPEVRVEILGVCGKCSHSK